MTVRDGNTRGNPALYRSVTRPFLVARGTSRRIVAWRRNPAVDLSQWLELKDLYLRAHGKMVSLAQEAARQLFNHLQR